MLDHLHFNRNKREGNLKESKEDYETQGNTMEFSTLWPLFGDI